MSSKIALHRIENKFISSQKLKSSFLKLFKNYMNLSPFSMSEKNINSSIYFDTVNFDSLKDHINNKNHRIKIRIRSYYPNYESNRLRYIEIKRKEGNSITKDRMQIGLTHFDSLMFNSSLEIDNELLILNEDELGETQTIIYAQNLNMMLKQGNYKPMIEVAYNRIAFEKGIDLRITLDEDIQVKPLPAFYACQMALSDLQIKRELRKMRIKLVNSEDFLIEVKYTYEFPNWLASKFESHFMNDESFSKYLWSIGKIVSTNMNLGYDE